MYAFTESEKLVDKLAFVRDEFLNHPVYNRDSYTEDEISELRKLGWKLTEVILEYETLVRIYYERLERLENEKEKREDEIRKDQLLKLSPQELADKILLSIPKIEIDEFLKTKTCL